MGILLAGSLGVYMGSPENHGLLLVTLEFIFRHLSFRGSKIGPYIWELPVNKGISGIPRGMYTNGQESANCCLGSGFG